MSSSVVESYNTVLSHFWIQEHADNIIMLDNEAIYGICSKYLNIEDVRYQNVNQMIAQMVSSLTASARFDGSLNTTLNEFYVNMTPFKSINVIFPSFSPIKAVETAYKETISVSEITNECFNVSNMLASCKPHEGKYMSGCLMYRGDVAAKDCYNVSQWLKTKDEIQFFDGFCGNFKMGINYQTPSVVPGSGFLKPQRNLCAFFNSTCVTQNFSAMLNNFNSMYHKLGFTHHFLGEGSRSDEFAEAVSIFSGLIENYRTVTEEYDSDDYYSDDY
eukprot:TRINITY_DN25_c0_g1_i1.p1 TRINITY_DN25_c0_g1~~TRINITY_DN25_c0_g1_i1.p1  ORF type:complete len:274 (+),score=64.20 TRINITY_DN25_c0_g1_i1:936-1757(+)